MIFAHLDTKNRLNYNMTLSSIKSVKRSANNARPAPSPVYVDVSFCGDRSGSMASTRGGSQEGAVAYMQQQKETAEKLNPSSGSHLEFVSFDNVSFILYSGEATNVTDIDLRNVREGMEPRSMTRLFDTVIETLKRQIARIDDKISSLPKSVRDTIKENPWMIGTSCAIMTDGIDNLSTHGFKECKDLIKLYKSRYNGSAMFIGANIDAEFTANRMGINKDFALQMGPDRNSSINAVKAVASAQTRSISSIPNEVGGSLGGGTGFSQLEREVSCMQNVVVAEAGPSNTGCSLGGGYFGSYQDDGSGRS